MWALLYLSLYALDACWPSAAAMMGFALTFLGLSLTLVLLAYAAEAPRRVEVLALMAVWPLSLIAPSPLSALLSGGALLIVGVEAGAWVGRRVQVAGHLWPLALVACAADAWSVASPSGPTQRMLSAPESAWSFASALLLVLPSPGVGLAPILGVADALMVGLLLGAAHALGLSARRLGLGIFLGLMLCLIALLCLARPLPALPFIAVAGVAALGGAARPAFKDLLAALLFCLFFVGLALW